jgi:hypothetical protein
VVVTSIDFTAPEKKVADEMAARLIAGEGTPGERRVTVKRQRASGVEVTSSGSDGRIKKVLVLQAGTAIGVLVVGCPDSVEEYIQPILDSLSLDEEAPVDPIAQNGLTLSTTEGLTVWPFMGAGIMLKEAHAKPPIPNTSPVFSVMTVWIPKEEFEHNLADMLAQSDVDPATVTRHEVLLDGLPAIEVEGKASRQGEPVNFYGVFARESFSSFSTIIGCWGQWVPGRPDVRDRYRRISQGIKRLPNVIGPVR